jgi:hypothetical protein
MMQVLAKTKPLWLTKTFAFNTFAAALEIAQILLDFRVISSQYVLLGMAVGNVILRYLTKQPATVSGTPAKPVQAPTRAEAATAQMSGRGEV